jgi:two-component sensor histidine kinase/PAS domain-containing protein
LPSEGLRGGMSAAGRNASSPGADMTPFTLLARSLRRRNVSQAAGLGAILIAALASIGWWAELPLLLTWGAGIPPVKPVTALCLAFLGLALVCPGKDSRLLFRIGVTVAAIAVIDLGLAPFAALPSSGLPEQVVSLFSNSAVTALSIALAGTALALSGFQRHYLAAAVLAIIVGAVALFVPVVYLSTVSPPYAASPLSDSPSLPTVVGLFCIALGIIARVGAMPEPGAPRPLWQLLAVLGLAIGAPLLMFGAYAGGRTADAQVNQIRQELINAARMLSADVDREIVGEIETLEALAASPSLQHGDFAALQRQAEAPLALRPNGNIALVDRGGRQIINTSAPFGAALPKTVIHETVERALTIGRPQVTGLYTSTVTGQPVFSIILPVGVDGTYRYALIRSPSPLAIVRVVAASRLLPGSNAVVSDAAHRILAQSGEEEVTTGADLPRSQWVPERPAGLKAFTDSKGRNSLQAYARSDLTGWEAAVWAPEAALGEPLAALWQTLGFMALLSFALVVALASWVGRIIARSVGHAARAAVALGEGRPLPPTATSVAEINTLMAQLEETAAKRRAAEDSLREGERRLQLALAAAQLGSWQCDARHRVLAGDWRARQILEFSGDEEPLDEVIKRVHPNDAGRVEAVVAEALDSASQKPIAIELRLRLRHGGLRWVEIQGLSNFDETARDRRPISISGTVADITARKEVEEDRRAREEKEGLLMREMHHRAKNMLSVVDAIAHQTVTRNPDDFVARFSERIQALSANQDLLVRNEWKGVEIKALVNAQLAHFADLIGSRIAADGPQLSLKAVTAQAIGLALHELSTNAGKYGALSTNRGRVDIGWGTDGDTFTMSWIESDGPPVSEPTRRGFGSVVMGVLAERSLGGSVNLDYAPAGVQWRLTCPAANALEAYRDVAERLRAS